MKKYLHEYIKATDEIINNNIIIDEKTIENHLTKISFFQHERLIHLLVTLFYATIFLLFTILGIIHYIFFIISIILSIFLINYIIHYFKLENGIQYLYKQYDEMNKKSTNN